MVTGIPGGKKRPNLWVCWCYVYNIRWRPGNTQILTKKRHLKVLFKQYSTLVMVLQFHSMASHPKPTSQVSVLKIWDVPTFLLLKKDYQNHSCWSGFQPNLKKHVQVKLDHFPPKTTVFLTNVKLTWSGLNISHKPWGCGNADMQISSSIGGLGFP